MIAKASSLEDARWSAINVRPPDTRLTKMEGLLMAENPRAWLDLLPNGDGTVIRDNELGLVLRKQSLCPESQYDTQFGTYLRTHLICISGGPSPGLTGWLIPCRH